MGRNYFSKHGGPYFINDGFHSQTPKTFNQKDKENQMLFYGLLSTSVFVILGFVVLLRFLS
jgi:hypothetical protein